MGSLNLDLDEGFETTSPQTIPSSPTTNIKNTEDYYRDLDGKSFSALMQAAIQSDIQLRREGRKLVLKEKERIEDRQQKDTEEKQAIYRQITTVFTGIVTAGLQLSAAFVPLASSLTAAGIQAAQSGLNAAATVSQQTEKQFESRNQSKQTGLDFQLRVDDGNKSLLVENIRQNTGDVRELAEKEKTIVNFMLDLIRSMLQQR